MSLTTLVLTGLMSFGQVQFVEGLGKVPTKIVTQCLIVVGVEETDLLYDRKWESFQDCVNYLRSKKVGRIK